jgi:AcrR family transcriptional regulator
VGPARTTVAEIARRAGVQRLTVYNHFPDDASLIRACSAHWNAAYPPPDPGAWAAIEDPTIRLRAALSDLHARYRETEAMTANVLRDAALVPALGALMSEAASRYRAAVVEVLARGWGARGRRAARVRAAIALAVDFRSWSALVREQGLADAEAIEVLAGAVEAAAG